jgi:MtaA/CmuA family methyltransferase
MTGLERTLAFIKGEPVDHPPFHPILMRWAAKYAGVKYGKFCTDPKTKCDAMIKCAKDFETDWVTVMSDPWAEASAFGIVIEYPDDSLPIDTGGHFPDAKSASMIKRYYPEQNFRCKNRLDEIRIFKEQLNNACFIVGWVEGPVAEYVDLRRASEAATDFYLDPEAMETALDTIVESAIDFISLQIKEGAHCIGIGDAFCSQIGPDLYNRFAFSRHKQMVDHIHMCGALAKLHICGDTSSILPDMIDTGADIIDIDHLVSSIEKYKGHLSPFQVFSGKSDPVTVIQEGNYNSILQSVLSDHMTSDKRCIVSAGCEITPGTSIENMIAFSHAAKSLNIT